MNASTDKKNKYLIETRIVSNNIDSRSTLLSEHKINTMVPRDLAVAFSLVWLFGCTSEFSPMPDEIEYDESSTSVFLDEDSATSSEDDTEQEGTDKDECPDDDEKLRPGICGCGVADTDGDGDGAPDCHDECAEDPNKTEPGICGCGVADTDRDGDGAPDCRDACAGDPRKTEPGICGCGVADTDSDGDSTPDCRDKCPVDSNKVEPGNCGCGVDERCGEWTWIYEAEDRTADEDASFSSGNPGYLGTGYMDYGDAGSFVEWKDVALPTEGSYTLDFRYASSFYNRPSKLLVNGVEQSVIPFNGAKGATWSDWRVNTVAVTLPAGKITIRVVAIDDGPNLDRMTITWANGN